MVLVLSFMHNNNYKHLLYNISYCPFYMALAFLGFSRGLPCLFIFMSGHTGVYIRLHVVLIVISNRVGICHGIDLGVISCRVDTCHGDGLVVISFRVRTCQGDDLVVLRYRVGTCNRFGHLSSLALELILFKCATVFTLAMEFIMLSSALCSLYIKV